MLAGPCRARSPLFTRSVSRRSARPLAKGPAQLTDESVPAEAGRTDLPESPLHYSTTPLTAVVPRSVSCSAGAEAFRQHQRPRVQVGFASNQPHRTGALTKLHRHSTVGSLSPADFLRRLGRERHGCVACGLVLPSFGDESLQNRRGHSDGHWSALAVPVTQNNKLDALASFL